MRFVPLFSMLALCMPCALHAETVFPVTSDDAAAFAAAALDDGRLVCIWTTDDAKTPQTQVMGAYYAEAYRAWFGPRPMLHDADPVSGLALLHHPSEERLLMFTVEAAAPGAVLRMRYSDSGGSRWSSPVTIHEGADAIALGTAATDGQALAVAFTTDNGGGVHVATQADDAEWQVAELPPSAFGAASAPTLTAAPGGGFMAYATFRDLPRRHLRTMAGDSGDWSPWEASNLPSAAPEPVRTAAILARDEAPLVAAGRLHTGRTADLALALSYDQGRTWPVRRTVAAVAPAPPVLIEDAEQRLHVFAVPEDGGIAHGIFEPSWINAPMTLQNEPVLATVAPPLDYPGHRNLPEGTQVELPVPDAPFFEHVRHEAAAEEWPAHRVVSAQVPGLDHDATTLAVQHDGGEWVGTDDGLYSREGGSDFHRHPHYGFDGPLANRITGLGADSEDRLWVATPGGLSVRSPGGDWRTIRGKEGLPWKELTDLEVDGFDRIWLGTTRGVVLHDPASEERPWYYRAGQRYLPHDKVQAIAVAEGGRSLLVRTEAGYGRIVEEPVTLHDKAEYLEERYNDRHRRLGLASPALYDDAHAMNTWTHGPQPSDGLWTSYHVTAKALAYSLTLDERHRASAEESMEAMYLLQNVTGIEGLVARTLVSVDEPAAEQFRDATNYHLTADGKYLWRDDVSSDQYDGHFLAFYAWFEHVAQFDPELRARVEKQIRLVLDYVLLHDMTIPDWNAERTMWGWWTPELLNEHPIHFQEVGIYSLMMLMFLKTAYYITEDAHYADLYRELIEEHDFLSNVLLEKKLFPDELNHSDDQLSAVAYYPILQLEHDPFIRDGLHRGARRHALVELAERNSFFAFVYATVDREDADVTGGLRTLREFPRDRRNWRMENSHRRDVTVLPNPNQSGNPVLAKVLPYDEHHFERWNEDPYQPDDGGDGRLEGSGEHYILPYWIARYHDLLAAP